MSVVGGRGGRNDDWSSQHARARARLAERLDGPLEVDEGAWLDAHLASCTECSAVGVDYAAQRLELRALRDREPVPPRDLWARTAAAIERESGHGSRRPRSTSLRPFALLAGALVVAIAVGTLTSSQWPFGDATTTPGTPTQQVAANSPTPEAVAPTPLAVLPREVAYLSIGPNGTYGITHTKINEVCPSDAKDCVSNQPHATTEPIGPLSSPQTVYGSDGKPLVIMGNDDHGSSVLAVVVPTKAPSPTSTPEPTESPAVTPSDEPAASADVSAAPATATPVASATPETTATATASSEPTAAPTLAAAETVEIAHGLKVIDTTAAYAPDGSAFAFTAEPADGSHGPDIYVWKVDDKSAVAVTQDHRSVFGSWSGSRILGSSLELSPDGKSAAPSAIVVSGSDKPVALPAAGNVWRPAVDRSGSSAVYWTGTLVPDGDGWKPGEGRLVMGRWTDIVENPDASAPATPPAPSDQADARHELTIADGPLTDWDARWDDTGTRLAVWIANRDDPSAGKLSLYVVDPFDGSIDLAKPPLRDAPALAGFSLDNGRLAWATPAHSSDESNVLVLAWTADEFGQVESAPGDFVLVR